MRRLIQARLRRALRSVVTLHGSPEAIALGTAIGVFVAFTPTIGLQMIIAAVLATMVGASRIAAIIPVWLTNPVTIPPIFAFTYWVGRLFRGGPRASKIYHDLVEVVTALHTHGFYQFLDKFADFLRVGFDIFISMMIGGVIVGVVLAVPAYPLTFTAVLRYRQARQRRREHRAARRAAKQARLAPPPAAQTAPAAPAAPAPLAPPVSPASPADTQQECRP